MSDCIDDGGPAFARPSYALNDANEYTAVSTGAAGMSLRDWFAGLVMNGLVAANAFAKKEAKEATKLAAISSYMVADAMLEARKQKGTKDE